MFLNWFTVVICLEMKKHAIKIYVIFLLTNNKKSKATINCLQKLTSKFMKAIGIRTQKVTNINLVRLG